MATLQDLINNWRILVGETDAANSRWTDATHGKFYINLGRREFSKVSKAIKSEFRQTTTVGATVAGSNEEARYSLDPLIIDVLLVYWDGNEVKQAPLSREEATGRLYWGRPSASVEQGIPYLYRKIGNSIDLFPAPSEAKTLVVVANAMTTDLASLATNELEVTPDQQNAVAHYAAYKALTDDGRDGSIYFQEFLRTANQHRLISNPVTSKGPKQSLMGYMENVAY